jgi:Fe-S oxidoreductase
VRLAVGLLMTAVALAVAGRRVLWLYRLVRSGQAAPGRLDGIGRRARTQLAEVFGQRKLLKWTVPGVAHFLTFWGFIILAATILEAYGALFDRDFAIPLVGHWPVLGFLEDFFGVAVLVAVVVFSAIRLRFSPKRRLRGSRHYGSHNRAAWLVLFMIFNVVWTLFLYRGAQVNTGVFPFESGAFASEAVARLLEPLGEETNELLETVGILAQIGVVLAFLVLVVYSKHLHIFTAPLNVLTKREPKALGALLPIQVDGKPVDFENLDELDEDAAFGRGKVEDFTWRGMLDFATCTECGRCQDQCPAWNTGKPLSPKLVIMDLRDHLFAKAPHTLSSDGKAVGGTALTGIEEAGDESADRAHQTRHHGVPESGFGRVPEKGAAQVARPLVGTEAEGGVIDPDVLWSCTTCGACVEQCPVDIEHVDHIMDMRRFQVLVESSFPSEAGTMLKNLENKGNPWGLNARARLDWTEGLDFTVPVVGEDVDDLSEVDYLYWVGCAGALEDRAKKTTRAFAELLHIAGVRFAVLGEAEACSGDPARRLGNEFVFQMLAQQNVETLTEAKATTIVATCPHCFNSLAREYPQLGGRYDVIHHTQLLSTLVEQGRLTPITPIDSLVTYHDPCYLGRHNQVYSPPREILQTVPRLRSQEMHRCRERGFCCGAGGARMWMEEKIGKRVNVERVDEALELDPDIVSTACPFCLVMLGDAVTAKKQEGTARPEVEVVDVAQLLVQSVRRPPITVVPVQDDAETVVPVPDDHEPVASEADEGPSAD